MGDFESSILSCVVACCTSAARVFQESVQPAAAFSDQRQYLKPALDKYILNTSPKVAAALVFDCFCQCVESDILRFNACASRFRITSLALTSMHDLVVYKKKIALRAAAYMDLCVCLYGSLFLAVFLPKLSCGKVCPKYEGFVLHHFWHLF
eukprot:6212233-Pleurochrysis_carterae.AAC.1